MDKKIIKFCDTENKKTQISPTKKQYLDKQYRYLQNSSI